MRQSKFLIPELKKQWQKEERFYRKHLRDTDAEKSNEPNKEIKQYCSIHQEKSEHQLIFINT